MGAAAAWAAPPPTLTAPAQQLVQQLAAGQYTAAETNFDATMKAGLPADKLAAVWASITAQVGPFQSIAAVSQTARGNFQVVTVTCKFAKAELNVNVAYNAQGQVAGLHFAPAAPAVAPAAWAPPGYANPTHFHELAITVADGRWRLPGTLTLPNGSGPFPALVLVAGSGAEDQDETIGPNKPFKDLAWGLASQGIAVLRYDKRTYRYANELAANSAGFTVMQEYVDDARAAASLLAARPDIAHGAIFVLGHSQGGTLAPRIAHGDAQLAGLIVMAGATQPLGAAIVRQLTYLATLPGAEGAQARADLPPARQAEAAMTSPTLKPTDQVNLLGAILPGSYLLDLRSYHPVATAAALQVPMLILQGGRDYQVTRTDFAAWKSALADHSTAHSTAQFHLFPDLDHLFMVSTTPGAGPGTPADYAHAGHVAAPVIALIARWIQAEH